METIHTPELVLLKVERDMLLLMQLLSVVGLLRIAAS